MKNTLIVAALAIMSFASCKKEDKNKIMPDNKPVAEIVVSKQPDQTLKIDINYTASNTEAYYDDLLKVYIDDTFTQGTTIDPKPASSTHIFITKAKFTGAKYRIELVREKTPGDKSTIATKEGN